MKLTVQELLDRAMRKQGLTPHRVNVAAAAEVPAPVQKLRKRGNGAVPPPPKKAGE